MSILPSFLNIAANQETTQSKVLEIPKEYGIDFNTGQLTGEIVEGIEAIKVWIWMCIHIERYRFPIYSWQYGCEFEQYIGQTVTDEFLHTDCRNALEEALKVNLWIEGISSFEVKRQDEKLHMKFTVATKLGETEVETDV